MVEEKKTDDEDGPQDERSDGNVVATVVKDDDENKNDEANENKNDEAKKNSTKDGEKKKGDKAKITLENWPMKDIAEPHENDVLFGRGGGTNHHPGNKRYRKMVEDRKLDYVNSKRLDKPLVALEIIREWRGQDPPGRFLKIDEKTGLWHDVGDKKAREKTSQALREKAPIIRKQQEDERMAKERGDRGEDDEDESLDEEDTEPIKTTTFAAGTNFVEGSDLAKAVLARDHSLGREYLEADEAVTLDGFSWQDPFQSQNSISRESSAPAMVQERVTSQGSYGPPPHGFHPTARTESHGSVSSVIGPPPPVAGHYRYPSHGSVGPPPPPPMPPGGGYGHMTSDERHHRYTSSGRYESWGSMANVPPPPIPGYGYPQYSGSWSYRDPSMQREHSLGQNPLPHATISQPANYSAFDSRAASGQWGPIHPPPPHHHHHHHHVYQGPPPSEGPPPYMVSSNGPPPLPYQIYPHPLHSSGAPPPYSLDPAVASTWSGQDANDIAKTWSSGSGNSGGGSGSEDQDKFRNTPNTSPRADTDSLMPKPDLVKRATSNQNETFETKPDLRGPSVKRAALNRDNSMASNRLKEKYLPDYFKRKPFDHEQEMQLLSDNLEQSTLDAGMPSKSSLSIEERASSIDCIAMDLMVKPFPLSLNNRSSTIEALALDFEDDPFIRPEQIERSTTMDEVFKDLRGPLARPSAISINDRLTTTELLEIVNEPIVEDEPDLISGNRNEL